MNIFKRLATAFHIYRIAAKHPRMPGLAKILPLIALIYAISPIDLVPDLIPLLGQLDDVVAVVTLLMTAFNLIPKDIKEQARKDIIDIEPKSSR